MKQQGQRVLTGLIWLIAGILIGSSALSFVQARDNSNGSCWQLRINDNVPYWDSVGCGDPYGVYNTPTPEVAPSATASPTASSAPSTPTKVPTLTPSPISPESTSTPLPVCTGYPCWHTVDRVYVVVSRVWICKGAAACGNEPDRQIRLRDTGETVHVLCIFETADHAQWVAEYKCADPDYTSQWSALVYAGRTYFSLVSSKD